MIVQCSVPGCSREKYRTINGKPYCNKHRMQLRQRGEILERTRYDPNVFIIMNGECHIQLFGNNGEYVTTAIVDESDYDLICKYKWFFSSGYAATYSNGMLIRIHKFIMSTGDEIDHIDGNGLNNKRNNLRCCTHAQNICNQKNRVGTSSRFKGVFWRKDRRKWQSYISHNGIRVWLGCFKKEVDAAIAYNKKANILHGEFARLNVIWKN